MLGACLVGGRSAVDALHDVDLRRHDFSRETHGHVWGAIAALHARGSEISAVSVADALESEKNLAAVGGAAELASLQAVAVAGAHGIREAARIVAESAALRRIAEAATLIARSAIDRDADAAHFASGSRVVRIQAELGGQIHGQPEIRRPLSD